MAAALTPRVRLMAICDGIRESKNEAGVFDLKGLRQGVRVSSFPFTPRSLHLLVLLSNPRGGAFPCYVRVVNDQTEKAVYFCHVEPCPTFGAEGGLWVYYAPLQCTFPNEGRYNFELWFFREHGADVLKGETAFLVASS